MNGPDALFQKIKPVIGRDDKANQLRGEGKSPAAVRLSELMVWRKLIVG